jgi:hypothetical protein
MTQTGAFIITNAYNTIKAPKGKTGKVIYFMMGRAQDEYE